MKYGQFFEIYINIYEKYEKEKSWSERTCMNANHDSVLLLKHRYCLPSRQEKFYDLI